MLSQAHASHDKHNLNTPSAGGLCEEFSAGRGQRSGTSGTLCRERSEVRDAWYPLPGEVRGQGRVVPSAGRGQRSGTRGRT